MNSYDDFGVFSLTAHAITSVRRIGDLFRGEMRAESLQSMFDRR